ncbi:hypothetical protein BBJ28_00003093 [Nothophytophthora sp. Chile5]|nr:hypothetical protein BBJ28_00003093 [Nothophytophthora sp. Chile5]
METTQRTDLKEKEHGSSRGLLGMTGAGNGDGAKRRGPKPRLVGHGPPAGRKHEAPTPPPAMHQQPANGWNLATIKEGGKRAKPEAPKFLLLLYEILQTESARVIRWSEDGLSLQILDPVVVTEKILPKYFNHTNFHSFQRQLNYFGFRKWTKSKTDICTFSHPYFRHNQPELLQLIKRKKAPRRTPVGGGSTAVSAATGANAEQAGKKLQSLSPCGKRKLPPGEDDRESAGHGAGMHIQMNTSNVPIQPAINGVPLGSMTTPHAASSNGAMGFSSQDHMTHQYLPGSALLNNVISPVAATECKKKAKKLDKKDYLATATLHAPLASPTNAATHPLNPSTGLMTSSSTAGSSNNSVALTNISSVNSDAGGAHVNGYTTTALPTLDIVRNRIIRRQQAVGLEQQPQQLLQQQQQQYYSGYFPGFPSPNGPGDMAGGVMEIRPELLASAVPRASMIRPEPNPSQSPVFSNSFSDPVNILLRIKKSRTSSGEGADVTTTQEQAVEQSDNLASLHNFLLGHSLYTNRLEAQLKFVAEENEALKHLLDSKQREMDTLQSDRKVLQHENAVLLEDKNKLFEINRDLLGKLFPQ